MSGSLIRVRTRPQVWLSVIFLVGCAQILASQSAKEMRIQGRVVDTAGAPIAGALVHLLGQDNSAKTEISADASGAFVFSGLTTGRYALTAEKSGISTCGPVSVVLEGTVESPIQLVLGGPNKEATCDRSNEPMEFADTPSFTVAGVTDWTAAGGHGSDAILRTSEALTHDTVGLKPGNADTPARPDAGSENAKRHRLAGDDDEKRGDPLAAVHEYQEAARLDPSEENYFAWGSELLLHRAVWQAKDVFEQGVKAYPQSGRLQTALGSALFAGALYAEAAKRLCIASDLNPADPEPYIFLGRIEAAAPDVLPCAEPKLARFVQREPENPLANLFYAVALWKEHGEPLDQNMEEQVRLLLTKAVTVDPKCGDAYLELGNLDSSQKNYPAAIESYKKAIRANEQLSEAHYRLAVAYDRIGDQTAAREEFKIHDDLTKQQAATVDRERREVKQFVVVPSGKQAGPTNQ